MSETQESHEKHDLLENYTRYSNGVIRQIVVKPVTYDYAYSNRYNTYGEKSNYMSYLRYGVLLGALNKIPDSIVDVGYGNGSFLGVCQKQISRVYGCDVSDYPPPEGVTKIPLSDISNVDVVCFFDSLEHFDDISFVKDLSTKYVYISVPWCHYISKEWFRTWYHRRENEHIYHFDEASLKRFFDECGYDCIYTGKHEDAIRFNAAVHPLPNILSCIFKKRC